MTSLAQRKWLSKKNGSASQCSHAPGLFQFIGQFGMSSRTRPDTAQLSLGPVFPAPLVGNASESMVTHGANTGSESPSTHGGAAIHLIEAA